MAVSDSQGSEGKSSGPQYLVLARVLRPHGVRGDLNVQILTDFPERLRDLDVVYLGVDPEHPRRMSEQHLTFAHRARGDQWIAHLEGVEDRDAAEAFRSQYMFVSLADAVPLEEGEVYLFQVIGLEVQTNEGETLGRVTGMIETGANDVYIVQGEAYGEILIPAIQGVILDIDPDAGIMRVQLPPGLLPGDEQ
jgi:16S rRNA processing protein RimM